MTPAEAWELLVGEGMTPDALIALMRPYGPRTGITQYVHALSHTRALPASKTACAALLYAYIQQDPTYQHGRAQTAASRAINHSTPRASSCALCGQPYGKLFGARYCSNRCRKTAWRRRVGITSENAPIKRQTPRPMGPLHNTGALP